MMSMPMPSSPPPRETDYDGNKGSRKTQLISASQVYQVRNENLLSLSSRRLSLLAQANKMSIFMSKQIFTVLSVLTRATDKKKERVSERAKECKTVTHFYPMCTLDNDCFHFCLLKRTHLHRARSHTTQTLAQCSNGPMNEQTNAKSFT